MINPVAVAQSAPLEIIRENPKDAMGRRRAGRKEIDEGLAAYVSSGLTAAQFAKKRGLNTSTFYARLRRAKAAAKCKDGKACMTHTPGKIPAFVEVRAPVPAAVKSPATPKLTVTLPGGVKVEGCDVATAAELIRLMKGAV